jgi:benzoyl-CoA reductase/2-hydroxyglutaryl-CoA dehydratase subunit BcrC/BadD/HgdB
MSTALQSGLFDRVVALLSIVDKLPYDMSDEEIDGVLNFLPPDATVAMRALFAPRVRQAGTAFLKATARWLLDARRAPERGIKTVLIPFNFPPEMVHAFAGAHPITSEVLSTLGVAALEGQGERYWDIAMGLGLPDHLCSANTIELGSVLGGEDFRPDAIISAAPGGCDVNSKIHEFVSNYLEIPQFLLEKPVDDAPKGRRLYGRYMVRLVEQLEAFLGEELSEERLRSVVEKANRCTELYHELWDLQKAVPCPVPNLYSLFIYGTRFTMWGTDEGIKTMQTMVDTASRRLKDGAYPAPEELARAIWVYTSYYFDFMGLFNWMEEQGYTHLGDGLDLFFPEPIDTSTVESMIDGLAEAAWNMPMTRQVGGESMSVQWTEDVLHAVRELNADCAIYCGHHACKQTWSVVSILRSELMKTSRIPLLNLQGDSWIKRMTPISVIQHDVEEFIGNVVARKQKKRARKGRRREAGAVSGRGPGEEEPAGEEDRE